MKVFYTTYNKSDRLRQTLQIHSCGLITSTKFKKQNKHIDTENKVVITSGERVLGEGEVVKGGPVYGDRWKLNFQG